MKLSDEVKVAFVGVACVLGLTFIAQNVLNAQLDALSQNSPALMLAAYLFSRQKKWGNWIYWSLGLALVTLLIIAVYSI